MTSFKGGRSRRPVDDTALPSVEEIDIYLASTDVPPRLRDIARAFGVPPQLRAALRRRLSHSAFARLSHEPKTQSKTGLMLWQVVSLSDDGFAYAQTIDTLNATQPASRYKVRSSGKAPAVGDRFLGKVSDNRDSETVDVMRILPRAQSKIIGRITATQNGWMLIPSEKSKRRSIRCLDDPSLSLKDGDLVETIADAKAGFVSQVKPIRNLGPVDKPQAFTHLAIAEFELPYQFSDIALADAEQAGLPELTGRQDIRSLPLVTIDGEDAQDFDDAVYATPSGKDSWHVIVAIADVSHYVSPDSALDNEARARGNSVYLPGTVVPMLPEILSNGLCSLRPDEDRACLCVEFWINADGHKTNHRFFRGMMRSSARLTYHQVQQVMDGISDESDLTLPHGTIHHLAGVFHCLKSAREKRGTLELNIAEARVEFDEEHKPLRILSRQQTPAHQLIEELMVMANICAAETLESAQRACVFRVHDRPDSEKLEGLFELTQGLGLAFAKGQVITPFRLNQLLAQVKGSPSEMAVNEAVLRCQSRAVYTLDNLGHYGLGLARYAHFTSPIRRYSDLLVHRAVIEHLEAIPQSNIYAHRDELETICAHISMTEQRAARAERRTVARYAALLAQDRVGSVLSVTIRGVVSAGLFVQLDDNVTEGFIPRKTLPDDYYEIADAGMAIIGRTMGWRFAVGDELEAKLVDIEAASASVTLSWRSGGTRGALRSYGRKGTAKRRKSRRS